MHYNWGNDAMVVGQMDGLIIEGIFIKYGTKIRPIRAKKINKKHTNPHPIPQTPSNPALPPPLLFPQSEIPIAAFIQTLHLSYIQPQHQ